MITLSTGHRILFLLASGMMGFDCQGPTIIHRGMYKILEFLKLYAPELFTKVTKTITLYRIKGKKAIRPIDGGWWNNYGLDNPGLKVFLEKTAPKLKKRNDIIISIAGKRKDELRELVLELIIALPHLIAIEYNPSCPNYPQIGAKEIIKNCHYLVKNFNSPLILKLGNKNRYIEIAKAVEGVVEAININSVADESGGAISGRAAQKINWRILQELRDSTSIPVIAPSIWCYDDIETVLKIGAKAISFGSVSMIHPKRPWGPILPTLWARKYLKQLNKQPNKGYLKLWWLR